MSTRAPAGMMHAPGWIDAMTFTALDFETANASRASACAIGVVWVREGQVVRTAYELIRPDPPWFDPMNISIHGITPADVADAPCFAEVWGRLQPDLCGPVVAHNAAFDMSVLRKALDTSALPYPALDYVCSCVLSRMAWPGFPSYRLDAMAALAGVRFRHHHAEEDARACALVAIAAAQRLGAASMEDLPACCGLRIGRLYDGGYQPCGAPRRTRATSAAGPTVRGEAPSPRPRRRRWVDPARWPFAPSDDL